MLQAHVTCRHAAKALAPNSRWLVARNKWRAWRKRLFTRACSWAEYAGTPANVTLPTAPWHAVAHLCYISFMCLNGEEINLPTTTIRLPEDLKERLAQAAKRAGTTHHAFILEAIADRVDEQEHRNDFYDMAERRYTEIITSGKTIPWSEMRTYLEDRLAGRKETPPKARKLAR